MIIYLLEEIEWSRIIEGYDLQLQIRKKRKRLLDVLIFQAYTDEYTADCRLSIYWRKFS